MYQYNESKNTKKRTGNYAVFLDRDGVINPLVYNPETNSYESPKKTDDFKIFPYVQKALRKLKTTGYLTFIVSNQPDAAKGKANIEELLKIENKFLDYCSENGGLIDEFYYCHHHPNGIVPEFTQVCECRKPGTLFLEMARDKFDLNLSDCYFIGDRESDIICGLRANCKTVRIIHSQMQADKEEALMPTATVSDLLEAVDWILNFERNHKTIKYVECK